MDANIKKRWVQALRSGKYNQTREELVNQDGFCCLGVLCALYVQDHQDEFEDQFETGETPSLMEAIISLDNDGFPNNKVVKWARIDPRSMKTLIRMNDGIDPSNGTSSPDWKRSFNEIANHIEKRFK